MGTIFKQKVPFQKSYKVISTKADFEMEQDHQIAFWDDPSEEVAYGLLNIIAMSRGESDDKTPEDWKKLNDDFYRYVSEIIIDTDIEGVSFDAPGDAEAAFENPHIDWRFFWVAIGKYLDTIFQEVGALKKLWRAVGKTESSGSEEETKEEK